MYVSAKEWLELQKELLSQRQQYADLQVRVLLQAQIHEKIVPILRKFDNIPRRYDFMVRVNKIHQANCGLEFLLETMANPSSVSVGFIVFNKLYDHLCNHSSEIEPGMYKSINPEYSSRQKSHKTENGSRYDDYMVVQVKRRRATLSYYISRGRKFEIFRIVESVKGYVFSELSSSYLERILKLTDPSINRELRSGMEIRDSLWPRRAFVSIGFAI